MEHQHEQEHVFGVLYHRYISMLNIPKLYDKITMSCLEEGTKGYINSLTIKLDLPI
jgi:hypothetical protein